MDYILTNENDNFSVDVYFTKSPTPDCPPRNIPAASESVPNDIHGKSAKQTLQREKRDKSSIA